MLIYELYIDKFAVNIAGLISKLDYIRNLGMDAIWILPHYPSPMIDGGYDVSDFKEVRPDLGTLNDFKRLIKEAHKKGLLIIVDLPLNHTSTEHYWFKEARFSADSPRRDYYIWSKSGSDMLTAINAFPNAKLSNWIYNPFTKDHYFATFYPLQPDLNWDHPQVLEEFLEIIDFWCEMGIDGFRLDAVTHLIKRRHSLSKALPETHNIVKAIRMHLNSKYPNAMLIGETDLPTTQAIEYFGRQNDECDVLFDFEGSLNLWQYILKEDKDLIDVIKNNVFGTQLNKSWIYFLGSHDSLELNILPINRQEQLKQYLDPDDIFKMKHDKRLSLRTAEILSGDKDKILKAHKSLMSMVGHKVVYYGDEIGQKNASGSDFMIDNRDLLRSPMDWEEVQKQQQDNESLLNALTEIFKNR